MPLTPLPNPAQCYDTERSGELPPHMFTLLHGDLLQYGYGNIDPDPAAFYEAVQASAPSKPAPNAPVQFNVFVPWLISHNALREDRRSVIES